MLPRVHGAAPALAPVSLLPPPSLYTTNTTQQALHTPHTPPQDIFRVRSKIIGGVRRYLDDRGFLEVGVGVGALGFAAAFAVLH